LLFQCLRFFHRLSCCHLGLACRLDAQLNSAGMESEATSASAWNANETLVRALLEHAAVVSATFVGRLGLIDLHLLNPAEGVFSS